MTTEMKKNKDLIKILSISGGTGSLDIKLSMSISNKINSFINSFIPEPDVERELRMLRRQRALKQNMAKIASKVHKDGFKKFVARFENEMLEKFNLFSELSMNDANKLVLFYSTLPKTGKKNFNNLFNWEEQQLLKARYRDWKSDRLKKKGEEGDLENMKVKEDNRRISEKIEDIAQKLTKVVLKTKLQIEPIKICICNEANEIITIVGVDIGSLELLIDDIFTQTHFFKLMGLTIESRKRLYVLSTMTEVRFAV